jgi:hypothetical protein
MDGTAKSLSLRDGSFLIDSAASTDVALDSFVVTC